MRKCTTTKALLGLLTLAVSAVGLRAADIGEPKNYRVPRHCTMLLEVCLDGQTRKGLPCLT